MEILAALAIVGVLTAVIVLNLEGLQNRSRRAKIVENLTVFSNVLRDFDRQVGVFPKDLTLLSRKPTVADKDICGTSFTLAQIARWRGPYISQQLQSTGIILEEDTIQTGIKRKPAAPVSPGDVAELQIFVNNVTAEEAAVLDDNLDGDGSLTQGGIQWNTSPGYPRLIYAIPISGC